MVPDLFNTDFFEHLMARSKPFCVWCSNFQKLKLKLRQQTELLGKINLARFDNLGVKIFEAV